MSHCSSYRICKGVTFSATSVSHLTRSVLLVFSSAALSTGVVSPRGHAVERPPPLEDTKLNLAVLVCICTVNGFDAISH